MKERPMSDKWGASGSCFARILVCWTLIQPSGQLLRCEFGRTANVLEIRCAAGDSAAVRAEPVEDVTHALHLAALWKATYLARPGFSKASASSAPQPPSERPQTIL